VLPGQQQLTLPYTGAERLIAGIARSPLQTGTRRDPDPHHLQRNPQPLADGPAVRWPDLGCGLQTVVHVNGDNRRQRPIPGEPR